MKKTRLRRDRGVYAAKCGGKLKIDLSHKSLVKILILGQKSDHGSKCIDGSRNATLDLVKGSTISLPDMSV